MAFFNEINPCEICEVLFVREVRLTASEAPVGVGGFISLHLTQNRQVSFDTCRF